MRTQKTDFESYQFHSVKYLRNQKPLSIEQYWKEATDVYRLAEREEDSLKKEALMDEFKHKSDSLKKLLKVEK